MATSANAFLVNIVPLQGIATGIAGSADVAQIPNIQANLANLQSMVNYENKTISVDTIRSYTAEQNIQVLNNLNLANNAALYSNGILGTDITSGSGISGGLTFATATSITGTTSTITFTNAGQNVLQILSTGTPPAGNLSTGVSVGGYLYVSQSGYAQNWYQTSDRNQKTNIVPFSTCLSDILKLEPCMFNWVNQEGGKKDLGFIAQDVKAVWPILTEEVGGNLSLAYSRFVPLLLEGLRELNARVSTLEARLPTI
jgi:hypothetical protein